MECSMHFPLRAKHFFLSSKFERKILKNEGPDRFLVTPDLQHSRTEIIEFFEGFLALTSAFRPNLVVVW